MTIGMATYDDFDGVYFSVMDLRLHHDLTDTELVVVDNFGCEHTRRFVESVGGRYILVTDVQGTAPAKNLVFQAALGEYVLCLDSHVLLAPGALQRLRDYYAAYPDTADLLQGPLLLNTLQAVYTHLTPGWRGELWGYWDEADPRGEDADGEPFEIFGQGMGLFSCRRDAWPGYHPLCRGFGGEEGYIHEKFRQAGARTLCLPFLLWVHRFARSRGVPYPLVSSDKLRNYILCLSELSLDLAPAIDHFRATLPLAELERDVRCALHEAYGDATAVPPTTAALAAGLAAEVIASGEAPAPDRYLTEPRRGGPDRNRLTPPVRPARPLISCLLLVSDQMTPVPIWQLEEAVASFLQQDYPNKELIIVHDSATRRLTCDAEGVQVVNVGSRPVTRGDLRRELLVAARGDLLCPWGPADISLPWRLSESLARLGDGHYLAPVGHWELAGCALRPSHPVAMNHFASLSSRLGFTLVDTASTSPPGSESVLAARLGPATDDPVRELKLDPADWFLITRTPAPVSPAAASGGPITLPSAPVTTATRVALHPQWRKDYQSWTRHLLVDNDCIVGNTATRFASGAGLAPHFVKNVKTSLVSLRSDD